MPGRIEEDAMNRTVILLALPVAALLALGILLFRGRAADTPPRPADKAKGAAPAPRPTAVAAAPVVILPPASTETIAMATYEARVRTTFDNFWTAVATENAPLRDALRPVLLKDRDLAIQMARQQMGKATTAADRTTARSILDILERTR